MANKAISELPQALNVNNQDLFVLEQSGIAKKLPAETFITEQGIINALAEALDGHGGIASVTLSSVSGRIRTYLITFTDETTTTFQVLDGTSISRIEKTSTAGLVDTYTVFMTDGTTSFFQVRNGQDGSATWDQINSKAPIITETVTGAIANFPDGADDIPVADLVVDIEPQQNLNGYSNPWPAGGGGNIYDQSVRRMPVSISAGTTLYLRKNDATIAFSVFALDENNNSITLGYLDGTEQVTVTLSVNITLISITENSANTLINHGKTLMVSLAPITDVVPYSNICPITGFTGCNVTRTGKNLLPNQKVQDTAYRVRLGESVVGDGNFFKAGTYRISYALTDGTSSQVPFWRTFKNGVNGAVNNSRIVTLTEDTIVKIWLYDSNGISVNSIAWAMVELGSTATAYEPYQGNTVTVDWTTEAGTVYGGTIDVATGLLTVTHELVDLGTLTWSYASSGQGRVQSNGLVSSIKPASAQSVVGNIVCDTYKTVSANAVYSGTMGIAVNDNGYLWAHDSNYTDGATFKTAMSGHYLAYEVATPQTYQLTPQQLNTLLGTNNVWADTGNVSVTYPADTKMFIEKLTMPSEDDLVANQAITSGKYFMIGNSLYLALANIASGAQITIGTNAQRVSLADALNTINS